MSDAIATGLHHDLPHQDYLAQHDWLSASGIKKLIPPFTPAHFKAAMDAGEHFSDAFDTGKAVHALLLEHDPGAAVIPVDAASWLGKEAQAARKAIREAGLVPILTRDLPAAQAMADAVRGDPVAAPLFSNGESEVSAFWIDPATGVKCRARFDYLPKKVKGKRLIVPDLKTAISGDPSEFEKAAARYGYYVQAEHYRDALMALGVDDDPAFVFVTVEKEYPHLVDVHQFPAPADVKLARGAVDRARRIFAECAAADIWPGRPPVVNNLQLPPWLHYQLEEYLT
ncbi:PD-(D/E)XK nuclease-like domain-containing protein [Pimelobacter simplex]|uniref:PD-(D/E)XK nuclease-like domain-containing protein n=1 Tax=Nocardioides simplex TaxID=2045 RepID=UPI003AB0837A